MLPPEITHFDKIEALPYNSVKPENPPKTTNFDKIEEFPYNSVKPENPPETITIFDKIEEFLYNYIDLGFDLNLKLFIELYI